MKASTARANGWRCPQCSDATSRDENGQGYVRHLTIRDCSFEKGLRDGTGLVRATASPGSTAASNNRGGQGQETDVLGQWLTGYVRQSDALRGYQVFYDHGDSREANVAAIKGFFGTNVTNLNRLADVDVMIVSPDQRVMLLIEVEERGSSPKKILGDAVTIMMCNRFAVRQNGMQRYFEVSNTSRLIVSGVMPAKGNRLKKVDQVIVPRFRKLSGFSKGINPRNIDFVFRPSIAETVDQLKQMVVEALPAQQAYQPANPRPRKQRY